MKIIFFLLLLLTSNSVYADDSVLDLCANPEPLQVLLFAKYIITFIKILAPLIIILFGSIDFIKAIIASNEDALKKSGISLVKRLLSGILIFFLPTIISVLLSLVNQDFNMCEENLNQEKINELKQGLISDNETYIKELAEANAKRQQNESEVLSSKNVSPTYIGNVTEGVWFIQQWEGSGGSCDSSNYKAYNIGDGTITCGYGVTNHLSSLASSNGYGGYFPMSEGSCYPKSSIDQVQSLFIGQLYNQLDNYLTTYGVSLTQYQKDAMVSIGYQSGGSVMKACVEAYASGGNEAFWNKIKDRIKGNGKVYPGLKKRRDGEYHLFLTGDYNCGFYNRETQYY